LVDSKPLEDINHGQNLRFIARLCKQPLFGKDSAGGRILAIYNSM